MRVPRYFVDAEAMAGAELALSADDGRHARRVLRLRGGAPIVVVAGAVAYDAELLDTGDGRAVVRVVGRAQDQGGELPVEVVVAQALAKAAKFDEVVEKCVELGAVSIMPMRCARDVAERGDHIARWRRVARAAAQQSRRRRVPDVTVVHHLDDALTELSVSHLLLVADQRAPGRSLASALASADAARPLALFVGPEGGFNADELDAARRASAHVVSLGPTTLRTQTAAAALLAAVASSRGWW